MRSSINCVHTTHFFAPKTRTCQPSVPGRNVISSLSACMGSMFCLHPCTRTHRFCVRRSCTIPRLPAGNRCYAQARLDAPQRLTQLPRLLDKHGRGNHSLCISLHRHVRRQAHRQAHDRRQSEDIAPDTALPPSGPHRSRGTAKDFTIFTSAYHTI